MKTKRRKFIEQLLTASITGMALPAFAEELPRWAGEDDEAYWEAVKGKFSSRVGLVMMNAANLCPSPIAVNEKVAEFLKAMSTDVSFQYRSVFAELRKKSVTKLANFIGAGANEVGITRNTSESNCTIVHGLELKPGDEVIMWEQNHPSNREAWISQAKRIGFKIITVGVPARPSSLSDLVEPFAKAITPNTRVIAFSHISNTTGLALPAKDICQLAKSKNIMTLVDGAQSLGVINVNVHDMGCTFYTASTHKWMMGPFENGILYVQNDFFKRVWPNVIGGGWKESETTDAQLCMLGQRNEPSPAAIPDAIAFYQEIGSQRIYNRIVQLNTHLKKRIQDLVPKATFVTPSSPEFSAGITVVNLPGKESHEAADKLYHSYGVAAAAVGGIRLSPHIYNTIKDVDYAARSVAAVAS